MRSIVGSQNLKDLRSIERYCDTIHSIREDYITYLGLCAPYIASLKDETRIKMYELAWSLLFGDEDKKDKIESEKKVLSDIREQFKNIKVHGAEEIMHHNQGEKLLKQIQEF